MIGAAASRWLALGVMAHNLARWTSRLGLGESLIATDTLRRRYLGIPGRLTSSPQAHPGAGSRSSRGGHGRPTACASSSM